MQTSAEDTAAVEERDATFILGTYKRTSFHPRTGKGAKLVDADGKVYWDLLAGIAVNALGYRHPRLVKAMKEEATNVLHVSNLFYHPAQGLLAERLVAALGLPEGVLLQHGNRGHRGRGQAHAPRDAGKEPDGRARGRLPRPHDGRPRAHGQRGLPQAVRASRRDDGLPAAERRDGPERGRHAGHVGDLPRADPRRGRHRAAHAGVRRSPRAPRPTASAPRSSSTRSRAASGARGTSSSSRSSASRPTSSSSPSPWAAASRSGPSSWGRGSRRS